jgi:hypothetical protein
LIYPDIRHDSSLRTCGYRQREARAARPTSPNLANGNVRVPRKTRKPFTHNASIDLSDILGAACLAFAQVRMDSGTFFSDAYLFGKGYVTTIQSLNYALIPNWTHDKWSPRQVS